MKIFDLHFFLILLAILLGIAIVYQIGWGMRKIQTERFTGEGSGSETSTDPSIAKTYTIFPPTDKPKTRSELLHSIFAATASIKDLPAPTTAGKAQEPPVPIPEESELQKTVSKVPDYKSLMGTCQFNTESCPIGFSSLGQITGTGMKCGDGKEYVTAEAVAGITNGHLSKVYIVKAGSGYNSENPPRTVALDPLTGKPYTNISFKTTVDVATTGISIIDIVDYGASLENTPVIVIDPPPMASVCHLCCPTGNTS